MSITVAVGTPTLTQTTAQQTAGTAAVSFTVTGSSAVTVALSYQWRLASVSTWTDVHTSTLASTLAVTTSAQTVTGVWNLDADNITEDLTDAIYFRAVATQAAVQATGTLTVTAVGSGTLTLGDTFTVGGETFQFVDNEDNVTIGDIPVVVADAATQAAVRTAAINAVNGQNINTVAAASDATAGKIDFTADAGGVAGNVTIVVSTGNAGALTATGMTGGVDPVVSTTSSASTTLYTGSVDMSVDTLTPLSKALNTVTIYKLDRFGKAVAGALPQSYLKKSIVYEALDLFAAGTRSKFEYDLDYAKASASDHQRRAVLISVTEYSRVIGTKSVTTVLKSKQWLAYYANKALSNSTFFENNTVYAISSTKIVKGVVSKTIIAYLLSGTLYHSLAD
jgi:hypothetical protein